MANKIIIKGFIGRDPEITYSQKGTAVVKFPVATSNGKEKDPTWHNCVAFSEKAEKIAEYFKKGDEIFLEGKQENTKHEDKYYSSVLCFSFEFCGKKDRTSPDKTPDIPDDSIPF